MGPRHPFLLAFRARPHESAKKKSRVVVIFSRSSTRVSQDKIKGCRFLRLFALVHIGGTSGHIHTFANLCTWAALGPRPHPGRRRPRPYTLRPAPRGEDPPRTQIFF